MQTYRTWSDEELVLLLRKDGQNQKAFQVIYERYGHLVLGLCMKYLKNVNEAEDMTADIFEKLIHKIQVNEIWYFKSWIYQVSKNECLMLLRKKKPETASIDFEIKDNGSDLSSLQEKEITLTKLEAAVQQLKSEQRKCIELFFLQERSYQEISVGLNLSLKQVKSAIQNGKRILIIIMEKTS
ncbi:MAG: sigma-70 family RNA polymerase sigma factor [Crocinitomicaceae bacterium]|nr:sigma-70 family RNA polymerase sigma factor [Crocinitomicaceae bacterium]